MLRSTPGASQVFCCVPVPFLALFGFARGAFKSLRASPFFASKTEALLRQQDLDRFCCCRCQPAISSSNGNQWKKAFPDNRCLCGTRRCMGRLAPAIACASTYRSPMILLNLPRRSCCKLVAPWDARHGPPRCSLGLPTLHCRRNSPQAAPSSS